MNAEAVRDAVEEALRQVYDPEIPNVNIVDLGLIYDIVVDEKHEVFIKMTLTNPNCPVAETFPQMVQSKALEVPEVSSVKLELVWDPPWTQERLSEEARLTLGLL